MLQFTANKEESKALKADPGVQAPFWQNPNNIILRVILDNYPLPVLLCFCCKT